MYYNQLIRLPILLLALSRFSDAGRSAGASSSSSGKAARDRLERQKKLQAKNEQKFGVDYNFLDSNYEEGVYNEGKPDEWKEVVSEGYNRGYRPNYGSGPLFINVSIAIIRLHSIREASMSFGLDIYFRQSWKDDRLAYDPTKFRNETSLVLPHDVQYRIWVPDTYFPNAIEEKSDEKKIQIILSQDGKLWVSQRLQLILDCPMNLALYPFDNQRCQVHIGSYSSTDSKIKYRWMTTQKAVDFGGQKVNLPEFSIEANDHFEVQETQIWPGGNYSILKSCFVFQRRAGFSMIQMVIPAAGVVMCAWVALWVDEEVTFSDLIAVILAIIFLAYAQNSIMPPVSYVKIMDIYLGACFFITFISLAKLVLLKYAKKREDGLKSDVEYGNGNENHHTISIDETNTILLNDKFNKNRSKKKKQNCCGVLCCVQFTHMCTQILLPFLFGAFVIVLIFVIPYLDDENCFQASH